MKRIGSRDVTKNTHKLTAGRSRRALLAGATGALGLLAGETILAATPAQAGTDGDLVLGQINYVNSESAILNVSNWFGQALGVNCDHGAAIVAYDGDGVGVYAASSYSGGWQPTADGVHGVTGSPSNSGVWGRPSPAERACRARPATAG